MMIAAPHRPRTQELRVRRMADRQGLQLRISRRQDPNALDYGGHWLVDRGTGRVAFGDEETGTTLDACEEALKLGRRNWKRA